MCSVLEEKIIVYINTIADIVHTDCHTYHGAANKNIGNAFLLAWKICDGNLPGLRDPRDTGDDIMDDIPKKTQRESILIKSFGKGGKSRDIAPQEIVDSALMAILAMRVNVYNANLPGGKFDTEFNSKPEVILEFGEDATVHMGFGLHVGWAIEGAIGSKYKIDASYLSPNVNLAARLEAATGQFNVPMLLSEWFVNELSPSARAFCRKVDRVTVKGSAIPMEMWTFDIGTYPKAPLEPEIVADVQQPVDFATDVRFKELQKGFDPDFFTQFESGVTDYLAGHMLVINLKNVYK